MSNISKKASDTIAVYSLIIGLAVFIVAFISMYWNVLIGALNKPLLTWLAEHRNESLTYVAKMITTLANPSTVILVVIAIAIWAVIKNEYYRPSLVVGALALSAATSTTLKTVIMDVRPPVSTMVPMFEMDYSFPSGHTLITLVFLLTLGYVIYSRNFTRKKFYTWIVIALLGTTIIASTRLYLGYHWLTDIIASFGLGFIILSGVIWSDRFINDKYPNLE